ncbi:tRNA (guanosine(46)-N7)-methyltransferase TrmB [Candidatus Vondammii sp. HM_W22]|uniref:tRNA (guanosine(46)-N7)-methyltransferase TrmB n=1 Tax=Candidatus Vondammii sp. HM_W22 TaxID=2687299 RepID=UPI001F12BCF8|nr:tRNA (guanosine(46)-N7)-methyltransferase TrmB [Candidatus Vondammii sp. HM_W22]
MPEQEKHLRPIRSFVLREGRLTSGQQRAFDTIWPLFGIEYQDQQLDLPSLFGNDNLVYLEIGFGNGDSLAQMAKANPEINYLGIEVHRPGMGHLLLKIEELELTNVRVIRNDAVDVLKNGIANSTLAAVFLFFPDPWHKRKHNKRRILNATFVEQLTRVIKSNGFFHAATDWEEYAKQMMREMTAANDYFSNSTGTGSFHSRPDYRPLTKFEQRGQRLGLGIWDLTFLRH